MAEVRDVSQVTVPSALRRYRFVATLIIVLCMLAAGLLGAVRQTKYQATGSLVLQTPILSALTPTVVDQDRFVADQAAIMRTRVVAARSAENLNSIFAGEDTASIPLPENPGPFTPDGIEQGLTIDAAQAANLIEVRFNHADPAVAAIAVNAIVDSYSEIKREQALQRVSQIRSELQRDKELVETELASLQEELVQIRTESSAAVELSSQTQALLESLEELGNRSLADPTDPGIRDSLAGTLAQLQAIEVAQRIEAGLPAVADLLERIDAAVERRAQIQTDLLTIEREAEEAASDIALFSPAEVPSEPITFSLGRMLLIGAVLGVLPAAGVSFALASRRPLIEDPYYPEQLLGAPLLGIVPEFRLEDVGVLPVLEGRHTQAAEAFRFAQSGISAYSAQKDEVRMITVTSAAAGEGKSVAAANLGLVMGVTAKVLCIDLDLEGQGLTSLLCGPIQQPGISEILNGTYAFDEVIQHVGPEGTTVDVLSAGLKPDRVRHALLRNHLDEILERVQGEYEHIIIDLPGLLNIAYGSSVVRTTDVNLLVIAHNGDERRLAEMTARLKLLGAPVVGYLYNKAPLQEGRALSVARLRPAIAESTSASDRLDQDEDRGLGSGSRRSVREVIHASAMESDETEGVEERSDAGRWGRRRQLESGVRLMSDVSTSRSKSTNGSGTTPEDPGLLDENDAPEELRDALFEKLALTAAAATEASETTDTGEDEDEDDTTLEDTTDTDTNEDDDEDDTTLEDTTDTDDTDEEDEDDTTLEDTTDTDDTDEEDEDDTTLEDTTDTDEEDEEDEEDEDDTTLEGTTDTDDTDEEDEDDSTLEDTTDTDDTDEEDEEDEDDTTLEDEEDTTLEDTTDTDDTDEDTTDTDEDTTAEDPLEGIERRVNELGQARQLAVGDALDSDSPEVDVEPATDLELSPVTEDSDVQKHSNGGPARKRRRSRSRSSARRGMESRMTTATDDEAGA